MSEVLKNVHGHTTIELTNVHTGEKKIVEDDNTVTNFIDHLLNSAWPTTHPFGVRTRGLFPWFMSANARDRILDLTQGLMLFDKTIPEDNNFNYIIPGNTRYIGGGTDTTYSGDCLEFGSWNSNEYVDNSSVSGDRYVQYVWDFATNQANGKINSVCLTTRANGRVGGGSLLYNSTFAQAYNSSANYGSYFQIGRFDRMASHNKNDKVYVPHPFVENMSGRGGSDDGTRYGAWTLFYPWYDLDNDELLITNQSTMQYNTSWDNQPCRFSMQKGCDSSNTGPNTIWTFDYYNQCKIFLDCTGITKPLTIWKYHIKPTQWDIYSIYYGNPTSNNLNSNFDHMFIEKKEFWLPESIREELKNGWQESYNTIYAKDVERYKRIYANYYYSSRIFSTKDNLYQIFKPWKVNETTETVWRPSEYIYIWKIKTDLSSSEVIKLENKTDSNFKLNNVYYKDCSSIFVCDDYLFTIDTSSNLWMYTFADDSWTKIKNKEGKLFTVPFNFFPQRTYFYDKNNTLYIQGAGCSHEDYSYGMRGSSLIVKPLLKEGAILNMSGDFLNQVADIDWQYVGSYSYTWDQRGVYTYIKSNNSKNIFNMMYIGGDCYSTSNDRPKNPCIKSYNYINPIITTINNLPEEVEKTVDYTMKVTYRVSWSDPD